MHLTQTHEMKLNPLPYEAISSGRKTVEMRLNDEKRRKIKAGDKIRFVNTESGEELLVLVESVTAYPSFYELYAAHDKIAIGYEETETASPSDMLEYYPQERIDKYGALAIKIKLL